MTSADRLLTIARFARLARLSAKQLRRYDELGLLAPAVVDEVTGYRYYHPRQARTAATIALLRELDVPLGVVRDLLVADEARAADLLTAERDRRIAALEKASAAVAALGRLADSGGLPAVAVELRREPERQLAAVRAPSEDERVTAVTEALAERLAALVPDPSAPFVGLFPVDLAGTFEVVLGVELQPAPPGTAPLTLEAGPVAAAVHHGPRSTLSLTWWSLLAFVHERGLEPAGPLSERYVDHDLTHLAVPLTEE